VWAKGGLGFFYLYASRTRTPIFYIKEKDSSDRMCRSRGMVVKQAKGDDGILRDCRRANCFGGVSMHAGDRRTYFEGVFSYFG